MPPLTVSEQYRRIITPLIPLPDVAHKLTLLTMTAKSKVRIGLEYAADIRAAELKPESRVAIASNVVSCHYETSPLSMSLIATTVKQLQVALGDNH